MYKTDLYTLNLPKNIKRNSRLPKNSSQWREFLTNFDCRAQLVKLAGDGAQFPFIILMTGTLVCLLSVTGEFGVSTNNSPRLWTWTLEQYSIVSLFTHQSIFSTLLIQCLLNVTHIPKILFLNSKIVKKKLKKISRINTLDKQLLQALSDSV